jgi:predicted ATPase
MGIVTSMYSGRHFGEMVWRHRALSRPQVELIAARTSAVNECFY